MVDVGGLYVTPGLVDIHVHVYAGTGLRGAYDRATTASIPDGFTFRTGVTTVVDAGSSGWRNFPDFKERVIDRSQTRVLALAQYRGQRDGRRSTWSRTWTTWRRSATAEMASKYTGHRGRREDARISRGRNGRRWSAPSRRATVAKIPVMVDFGNFRPERPLSGAGH